MVRFVLRRTLSGIVVLLVITYLSFLAQDAAANTRSSRGLPLHQVAGNALGDTGRLLGSLLWGQSGSRAGAPYWTAADAPHPLVELLRGPLLNSLILLLPAMMLGGVVGGTIGALAAGARRPRVSLGLILLSIIGISTPSFFLGMLLQMLEIAVYKVSGVRLLPVGGFGWDNHLVLPVLVLAARPIAQVARLTYVRVSTILDEDFVRTARAKGLAPRGVWKAHVVPNAASTVLTATGTSLGFSLSSLPVVELLFGWPGMGRALLDALRRSQRNEATIFVLVMGALFVLANIALDLVYRALDPRLREAETELRRHTRWWEWLGSLLEGLWSVATLRRWRERRETSAGGAVAPLEALIRDSGLSPAEAHESVQPRRLARRRAWVEAIRGNPALVLGLLISLVLATVVVAGPALAPHSPYMSALKVRVDDRWVTPPAAPSPTYPLGTDAQGRDIWSLLLVGARRTLTIALSAVLVRLLVGGLFGFVAGWFAGSWLDRAIMGLAESLAAFPALLLAMLIVYAIGVRQGVVAFVLALAMIGWGEVMQTVRNQVMAIKPTAYIEGAVAAGLGEGEILSAHVLPNVWPTMVCLAFLEAGGVLMILSELGFLGVFIGGGLAAASEGLRTGEEIPTLIYYDVPEWSVMLANSWRSFRNTPWASLFPAVAFFVATLGFTSLGEGLRQLTERLTLSFHTLFSRYILAALLLVVLGGRWLFQGTSYVAQYAPEARAFDASRAMETVRYLSSGHLEGRLSGSPGADQAVEWIAEAFVGLGLQPGGSDGTYFQTFSEHYRDLTGEPTLVLRGMDGEEIHAEYGRDFVREPGQYDVGGTGEGEVALIVQGSGIIWSSETAAIAYGLSTQELQRTDRVLLRLGEDPSFSPDHLGHSGLMTVSPQRMWPRYELPAETTGSGNRIGPRVMLSEVLVDRVLATSGRSSKGLLEEWERRGENRPLYLPTNWTARIIIPTQQRDAVHARNVIALWPGNDTILDGEAVVVAAYYDGQGRGPSGELHPGANDNASGVAVMLETIRILKEQGFRPKRTMLFVAWVGGERHRSVDYAYFLRAHLGFAEAYTIVAGLELEGVGAGSGSSAVIWHTTRERITEVVQRAAHQVRTPLTTREKGLHADSLLHPLPSARVPSATISWAGSDALAHTDADSAEAVDPQKIAQVGRMTALTLMALASDPAY